MTFLEKIRKTFGKSDKCSGLFFRQSRRS